MKRVKVDFSATVKNGLIRANQKRASEPLRVGDEVIAFDPAEDMEFVGVVDHVSDDAKFAFLRMEWEDDIPTPDQLAPSPAPTFAYVANTATFTSPAAVIVDPVMCTA